MACKKCGAIIQDGLKICPVCGEDLSDDLTNDVQNQGTEIQNYEQIIAKRVNKKKYNIFVIIAIVIVAAISIVGVLLLSGTISLNESNHSLEDGKDIKVVNKTTEQETTKSSEVKTEDVSDANSESLNGDKVSVYGDNYTVPVGFNYKDETGSLKNHYLIRPATGAIIGFDLVKNEELTLDTFLENVLNTYETKKLNIETSSILEKDGLKYYEILTKEEISKKETKEHVEVIVSLEDGVIFDAMMYDTTAFGYQNYMNVLFNFIKSREIGNTNIINSTIPSFAGSSNEILNIN